MSGRRSSSIAANPVLIGAATTLVVIVAVFLAYNANNGLPFVPTYQLKANVPSAANLVKGNDVRIGGARVGVVDDIQAENHANGSVSAVLTLKLETKVKPLPKSSTILIRPRSALGLKYVEITEGPRTLPGGGKVPSYQDGATIPLARAVPPPVEIDQVFNTFNTPTRAAIRVNTYEFGNAFAGRGQDLNVFIQQLDPLLKNLIPVAKNLADPATKLNRFFTSLESVASLVAPVAEQQASLFRNLDTTFTGLAAVARPFIQDSISGAPPALEEAIRDLPLQNAFLDNSAGLFHDLRPGVAALRTAAPSLSAALVVGTPTLKRVTALNSRLIPTFQQLQAFAQDPRVPLGIKAVTNTVIQLNPTLANLTPAQTTCNYLTLWFRNVSSLLSEGDANGTWQRFIIIATPTGPNNEGGPSSAPANGPGQDNHLHNNPYPNTASPGQPRECEAGNEKYVAGQTVIGNTPGNSGTATDKGSKTG
jgi:phospholipid/cholesterol/gamma-HCH transport system substrate-binding protein